MCIGKPYGLLAVCKTNDIAIALLYQQKARQNAINICIDDDVGVLFK